MSSEDIDIVVLGSVSSLCVLLHRSVLPTNLAVPNRYLLPRTFIVLPGQVWLSYIEGIQVLTRSIKGWYLSRVLIPCKLV